MVIRIMDTESKLDNNEELEGPDTNGDAPEEVDNELVGGDEAILLSPSEGIADVS